MRWLTEFLFLKKLKSSKKIPLSKNDVADSIFWLLAQNGQYSCKAGYWFLKEEDASPIRDEPPVYEEGLWKENSPQSKCNLVRLKVIYDHTCDRCLVFLESPIHAVWSCPELDCVWGASVTWDFWANITFHNFSELMAWIIKNQELFSMLTWSIWTQRNQIRTK